MQKYLIGVLSFCFLSVVAHAAPQIQPPASIQAMMPPQAKTCFFAEVEFPTPVHNDYYLHFYEFPQTSKVINESERRNEKTDKDYIADLFTLKLQNRKAHYRLVRRLKLNRSYFDHGIYEFNTVSANFDWLVPAKRSTPILRLNCTKTDGFRGPFGADILFVFNKGFGVKPYEQWFHNFFSANDVQTHQFGEVDERGYAKVVSDYQLAVTTDHTLTNMLWNGRGFFEKPAEQ